MHETIHVLLGDRFTPSELEMVAYELTHPRAGKQHQFYLPVYSIFGQYQSIRDYCKEHYPDLPLEEATQKEPYLQAAWKEVQEQNDYIRERYDFDVISAADWEWD